MSQDKPDVAEFDETVIDALIEKAQTVMVAFVQQKSVEVPVHSSLEASSEDDIPNVTIMPDPSVVMKEWDLSQAETMGKPVDVGNYPPGTWFFFDGDTVLVGEAGSVPPRIIRKESRLPLTQASA